VRNRQIKCIKTIVEVEMKIDINSDVGEGYGIYTLGNDSALMPYITSANIACGLHAGDMKIMMETVKLAIKHEVAIGAHPGLNDREGFGRRPMSIGAEEVAPLLLYQIGALDAMVKSLGERLHHVKLHGALYNMAAEDMDLAIRIVETIQAYDASLMLYGLPNSMMESAAHKKGMLYRAEVFADRQVDERGFLVPRSMPGAVIHDVNQCAERIMDMIKKQRVRSINNKWVNMKPETICVHGDHDEAVIFVKTLNKILKQNDMILTHD